MESYNTAIPGCISAYTGDVEPDGWIFCDGVERDNINGKFDKLIEINVGQINNTNLRYLPPNYNNSVITSIDDSIINKVDLLIAFNLKKRNITRSVHNYYYNKTMITEYNNNCLKNENEKKDYMDNMIYDKSLSWIVKY